IDVDAILTSVDVARARHIPTATDVDATRTSRDVARARHIPAAIDADAIAVGGDVARARHVAIATHVNTVAGEHVERSVRADDVHRHRAAITYDRIGDLTDHVDDVIPIADI